MGLWSVANGQPLPCPPSNTTSITTFGATNICNGMCATISALGTTTLKSTTGYTLSDIPYLPTPYTGGTPVLVGVDDSFSDPVRIPFPFCFWGNKYEYCVIGANGQISFDTTMKDSTNVWPITTPLPAGSSSSTRNTIMGAYYDIDPSLGGTISWNIYGTAPCRTFVVSWSNIPLFNLSTCPGLFGTQQIVLYESTYAIDIFIENRPICTDWNSGNGILGIQGVNPADLVVYPGFNATAWAVSNFGCRFTPNGPASWTYSWTDAATGAPVGLGASVSVCPSITTTYNVRGVASSNCDSFIVNAAVTVNVDSAPPVGTVTVEQPTRCGLDNGKMTINGLEYGHTDTIYYTIDGAPQPGRRVFVSTAGTVTLTGLAPGTYSNIFFKVDSCFTRSVGPVILTYPPPIPVSVSPDTINTCVGVAGLITASIADTGTYLYNWSPAAYLSDPAASVTYVTPAVMGDYTYGVTTNRNPAHPECATTDSVFVHVLPPIQLHNADTAICLGRSVQVRLTGDVQYTYSWNPTDGVSDSTIRQPLITPTSAGYHTYYVSADYSSCPTQVDSFTIEVDTMVTPRTFRDTICLGMVDTVDMTVPGPGTGINEYSYAWLPLAGVSNPTSPVVALTPTTLGPGNIWSVTIAPHAANCSSTSIVDIYLLPNTVTISPVDTQICLGDTVTVIGTGSPFFGYQWIPTTGIATPANLNVQIGTDTSAVYTVTASFHRCPDMYATLNLNVQPNPSVFIGTNRFMCQFDTVHLKANISPEWYSSYTYAWTPSADLDHSNTQTVVFSGLDTTKLIVEVSTPAGCKGKDSIVINVLPGNFLASMPDLSVCPGDVVTLNPTTVSTDGYTSLTYSWFPWYYLSDSVAAKPQLSAIANQTYTLIATTNMGCKDTVSFNVNVYPAAVITMDDSATLYPGETFHIMPITNAVNFTWFPITGLSSNLISDPVASPEISTQYIVTAETVNGCTISDTIQINVTTESVIAMVNAFVPSSANSSTNTFKVSLKGEATLDYFRVFNRWGNLLFETKDISKGWDGTYNGTPQPYGVYIYEVSATTSMGTPVKKQGNVTLLR